MVITTAKKLSTTKKVVAPVVGIGYETHLTLSKLEIVAREDAPARLHQNAKKAMDRSWVFLDDAIHSRMPIYGLTTQFGDQVTMIEKNLLNADENHLRETLKERQTNLVISHHTGIGEEMPEEVVRATMLLRAHCLALGYSGVRPIVAQTLLDFLSSRIHPVVRRYGSIGASGDLLPLAAIAAALAGQKTDVMFTGLRMNAPEAISKAHLHPIAFEGREGLALINGTSFMTALAGLAFMDLERLFSSMLSAIAMSLEALRVIGSSYEPIVHHLKHHKGAQEINAFLGKFWLGSRLIRNLETVRAGTLHDLNGEGKPEHAGGLQDYYSLRAVPQGFGTFHENLSQAKIWIENEMNAVSDNPIIDVRQKAVHHCANFMGYYIVEASDILKMDIAQASAWIHALLANLVHPRKNFGLPSNLVERPDMYNGFRPLQLLAAALTVQNRKFAQIHQSFMLPTEGDNQDVNSLGTHAAFDLREAVKNLERLTAILLLASAQALELRGIEKAGSEARRIHKIIRSVSPFINADRIFSADIDAVIGLIKGGEFRMRQ